MNKQSNQRVESFYRCTQSGAFADTFYDLFLSKGPEIAQKFATTDFTHPKLMLRHSLLELLAFDRGLAGTSEKIERRGQRHKELEITPQMYAMWLDALCETIEMHDPLSTHLSWNNNSTKRCKYPSTE